MSLLSRSRTYPSPLATNAWSTTCRFTLDRGETLALVGEIGSGKSLTALSLLQLLPPGGTNPTGRIMLGRAADHRRDPPDGCTRRAAAWRASCSRSR